MYQPDSGEGPVAGCCEHGNEHSDSVKSGEFLDLPCTVRRHGVVIRYRGKSTVTFDTVYHL